MRKAELSLVVIALLAFGTCTLGQVNARIAAVGSNSGNNCVTQIISSGDFPGTFTALTSTSTFNGMSPAQLRANYDVLLFTWASDSAINADWSTRILPYLALGGGVIFEDPDNLSDLSPGVLGSTGGSVSGATISLVPGITNGISPSFANAHMHFTSWDPAFNSFIATPSSTLGLYGQFPGGGRMVITGPDNNYHGNRTSTGSHLNQYLLLLNEIRWVMGFSDCLQDSSTMSNIVFNPATGGYTAESCPSGTTFSGQGSAFNFGCQAMLQASGGNQVAVAGYLGCINLGKGFFQSFSQGTFFTVSTQNLNAGACSCLVNID